MQGSASLLSGLKQSAVRIDSLFTKVIITYHVIDRTVLETHWSTLGFGLVTLLVHHRPLNTNN